MKRFALPVAAAALISACARPDIGPEPSLAPRAAEAIDPRVAIPSEVPMGSVDVSLAGRLAALVAEARAAAPAFEASRAEAERLASAAGPAESDSWIAAQQALSRTGGQHGVTTRVAADIDELAATRLKAQRWISPADREAIAAAAADVAVLSEAQAAAIERLRDRLAR
ncbi:MAG: hypothetical protein ABIP07_05290 [Sphingomicrobium sp.]